jgi:hypothetical protein
MADGVFNISKGRVVEFYNRVENNDPATATIEIMLLQANEAETALVDHDNYSVLLSATGNTEATFTNYARKNLTDTDLAALPAPDDTNDRYDIDIPDQTWTAAGNTTNNTLTKFITGYDPTAGADTTILPMTHHDFSVTTDGSDVTAQINAAGFFRAA